MQHGALSVEPQGDREILITRSFNAPRALVWRALVEPELVKRWLGGGGNFGGWTLPVCEIDLKVGGKYRYEWHNTNGATMGMGGVFKEIRAPERLVATELFDDPWYPGGAVTTQVLTEQGGKTLLTMTITYASKEARDGVVAGPMASGLTVSYDALEAVATSLSTGAR